MFGKKVTQVSSNKIRSTCLWAGIYFLSSFSFMFAPTAAKQLAGKLAPKKGQPTTKQSLLAGVKATEAQDLTALFKESLADAAGNLEQLKEILSDLPTYADYENTAKVDAIAQDSKTQKRLGFVIDFGYAGHGPLTAFTGVYVDVVLEPLPDFVESVFTDVIKSALKSILGGSIQAAPATGAGQKKLKTGPLVELLFRLAFLANDFSNQKIDEKKVGLEVMLLLFRLAQTEGFQDVQDLTSKLSPPMTLLLQNFSIKDQSLSDFIDGFWAVFYEAMHYDFAQQQATELGKDDLAEVLKIMTAIMCRASVDFSKNPANKEQIKTDITQRLTVLFKRFKLYRAVKDKLIIRMKPFADALLQSMNMTLESVLSADDLFAPVTDLAPDDLVQLTQELEDDGLSAAEAAGEEEVGSDEEAEDQVEGDLEAFDDAEVPDDAYVPDDTGATGDDSVDAEDG
jgi:hypothetical protein